MTHQIVGTDSYEFARDVQLALLGARIPFTTSGEAGDNYSIFVDFKHKRDGDDIVGQVAFTWAKLEGVQAEGAAQGL